MFKVVAALLSVGVLLASPVIEADDRAEAKRHFEAGVALINAENFSAAAVAFENALRLYPTRMVLFNLANCYWALQRYGEALDTIVRLEREFGDKLGRELEEEVRVFRDRVENLVGRLVVTVEPAGATISVDGRRVGVSPLAEALVLGPGDYEVEVSLTGYATLRRAVRVDPRGVAEVSFELERAKGRIRVSTETAGARVLLDGVEVGIAPLDESIAAEPGTRVVRLELEGYEPLERKVEVEAEQQAALFLSMVKSSGRRPARGDAVDPGAKEAGRGAGPWRFVGLGLTLAAGATTGVFYGLAGKRAGEFEDARDEWNAAREQGLAVAGEAAWSEMDAAKGDTERFGKLGLGFGIATGVLAVTTVVLFVVGGSGESESDGPAVSAVPGGLSVSF